jgi:hypothetical protein
METTSFDTANQYLRFGWKLINQHVVEATADKPAGVNYVLASVRTLDDTRSMVEVTDVAAANRYLELGWKLIDQYVTRVEPQDQRQESIHFVLVWQNEEPPPYPSADAAGEPADLFGDDLVARDEILPEDAV